MSAGQCDAPLPTTTIPLLDAACAGPSGPAPLTFHALVLDGVPTRGPHPLAPPRFHPAPPLADQDVASVGLTPSISGGAQRTVRCNRFL